MTIMSTIPRNQPNRTVVVLSDVDAAAGSIPPDICATDGPTIEFPGVSVPSSGGATSSEKGTSAGVASTSGVVPYIFI